MQSGSNRPCQVVILPFPTGTGFYFIFRGMRFRLSIKIKLFLTILSAHIVVYSGMYSIGRYNFERGFLEYINRVEQRAVPALISGLGDFFEHTGSWETLKQNPRKWEELIFESIESVADFETRTNPQQANRLSNRPLPR